MRQPRPLQIGAATFAWGRKTFIMSILNVTPDSFAGGLDVDAAVERGVRDVADGADILDVGGESTRPGASPVHAETEMARVLPVIRRLASGVNVPISIDTTKAEVARAALRAGASLVNDIHGLRGDPAMAGVVREYGSPVVAMANLRGIAYGDVLVATARQFQQSLHIAAAAGIRRNHVILDPGFGFGPSPQENLALLRRLRGFRRFGRPLLVGTSRKATIGRVLGLAVEQRLEGTAATVALAIANGADIVRVHDVRAMARVATMADAVMRGWPESPASGEQRAGR